MRGSLKIAKVLGIDIKIHWTFVLILVWGAVNWGNVASDASPGDPLATLWGGLYGVILMLLLFAIVVLHELGHSVAAIRFQIPVRDITLLPLGGVARIERIPEDPRQELVIALAGPAVNFALALILLPVVGIAALMGNVSLGELVASITQTNLIGFLSYLWVVNLGLGIFNLLPAFPMDGGRVLRAVLALFLQYQTATRIAVSIGQGIAILLGLAGFLRGDFVLILIALFVYFGAGQEGSEVMVRDALREVCAGDAYNKRASVLGAGQRVSEVVDLILTSYQPDFAVMVGSNLAGVVTRDRVVDALRQGKAGATVGEIMAREVLRVPPNISLYDVRQQMAEKQTTVAAVFAGNTYLGLVSLSDISEAFLLLAATPTERAKEAGQPVGSSSVLPRQG